VGFRFPRLCWLWAGLVLWCCQAAVAQETLPSPGDYHPWASFGVGSWKLVRVHTETLGPTGEVESVRISETKTTLDSCDEQGFTLKVEDTVDLAGKRFTDGPKYLQFGYNGEAQGQVISTKQLGSEQVTIDGREYATAVSQTVANGGSTKRISTVYFSPEVHPYSLRRLTDVSDADNPNRNSRSVVEVIGVEMPERVLTQIKSASHVKTVETFANGATKTTFEVQCAEVPGGVVSHALKQTNEAGLVTQRSTLELVNYEAVDTTKTARTSHPLRRGLLGRRR